MLRLGDRIAKFMGLATVGWATTGGQQSGTITDARFTQYPGCQAFAIVISGGFDTRGGAVRISISGNTLTWSYPLAYSASYTRGDASFIYGIF